MPTIRVPTLMRAHTRGAQEIVAQGDTVLALLRDAARQHAGLGAQLFDEAGELRRFLTLFLNDEDIRLHEGLASAVRADDIVEILPAIAGGAPMR